MRYNNKSNENVLEFFPLFELLPEKNTKLYNTNKRILSTGGKRENKNNKFFNREKAKMMQSECYVYIKTILID